MPKEKQRLHKIEMVGEAVWSISVDFDIGDHNEVY